MDPPHDLHQDKPLFRLANRWHVETRPEIIRQHLLFQPGDRYSRRRADESARLLRDLRYLYDARIEPVHYGDDRVDRVTTRDVWSLNPGISFGRRGGKNTSGFYIRRSSICWALAMGWPCRTSPASIAKATPSTSPAVVCSVPGRSFMLAIPTAATVVPDLRRSARSTRSIRAGRPEATSKAEYASIHSIVRGEIVEEFRERYRTYELQAGRSSGLRDGWRGAGPGG